MSLLGSNDGTQSDLQGRLISAATGSLICWYLNLDLKQSHTGTCPTNPCGGATRLARAISIVEDHGAQCTELLKALFPYSGKAVLLGMTGSPGAGKSTLVDQVAHDYRKQGKTIGSSLSIPPARSRRRDSRRSHPHAIAPCRPGIYIRSMATRGSLGGLASTTADVATCSTPAAAILS